MQKLKNLLTKWPWIWLAFILACAAAFFALHFLLPGYSYIPAAVAALGTLGFVLAWHFTIRKDLQQSVIEQCLGLDDELSRKVDAMSLPYATLDSEGRILWKNEAFTRMLEQYAKPELHRAEEIREIFPSLTLIPADDPAQNAADCFAGLGDRIFAAQLRRTEGETPITTLLLTDETEHLEVKATLERERGVAGVLYIDNYEELLKHTDPNEHSLLGALIEQQIQKFFQNVNGIVCKTERDRFYIFMNHGSLARCMEEKFPLLGHVKEIRAGNTMTVTVSIAFGDGGKNYSENLELAQAAMDLALGRGGDQAVVKYPDRVEYFGGKAQGEVGRTQVKARVKAQALRELMALHDNIYIMGHARGDNDSFGASVAIYRAAVSLHLHAHIVLDTVSFSVRPLWESFQASADYPRDMFLTGEEALARIQPNSLVVVVDTNRADMVECPALLEKTDQVVVFDHHRQAEGAIPAQFRYVEPYASSACEMVTEILQYFGEGVSPTPLEADAIYSGILVDTNSFTDRTSFRTFEAAAFLKRSGADLVRVKKMLREDFREYRAKAQAMQSARILDDSYAFAVCPSEGLDSATVVGSQVANDLLNISSVKASFVFTEADDKIFVSARAIDEVNVQLIMERLGGGGHLGSAGAQLRGMTVEAAQELVLQTIRSMKEEGVL
nr:DHH family phosphoesterase [Lachnospiraceae bacterium]